MNRSLLLALVCLPALAAAQGDSTRLRWVPNPRTTGGSWVADPAHHLSPATRLRVDSIAAALERETTAEIAVVVIDSLDGLEPGDAALLLHRRWGVGKRERDNGIVLLWSPALRRIHVSVGYGLEGVLPDARAGRIQDTEMLPAFRRGDFDAGVLSGVTALASAAREETYAGPVRARAVQRRQEDGAKGPPAAALLVVLLVILGAAGAVAAVLLPKRCPRGHGFMRRLSEASDDTRLDTAQQFEERVGSIDYHVWVCRHCDAVRIIPHRNWFSGYETCPACTRRTAKKTSRQIVAPTYTSTGSREVTLTCKHCGHTRTTRETIPMLVRTAAVSGGGHSGGGGGFSGGSSFGGGFAGGGGAGRSY